jgi:3-phenylpropionate/trans-cinnamate dioxygenase ferredoxin reductase component
MHRDALLADFKAGGRIVIVGASLAGLTAAETLRAEGFLGALTIIGDESEPPYDRPPLSKSVLTGWLPADHTGLPQTVPLDAEWLLGVPATGLDVRAKQVHLGSGQTVEYDRVLIATGVRARQWPKPAEAALDGVFTLRTRADAARLRQRLADRPARVLVIGGGFTGCEIASSCREQDLGVTLAELGPAPMAGVLGSFIAGRMAELHLQHGVDLRLRTTVTALEGDNQKRLRKAHLSNGETVDAEVAVVCLGAVRNTEWLLGCGLAVGSMGVACDAGCRALAISAVVTDDVFVAGDVARFPHPLYDYQFMALEHWGNAIAQAQVAAHNMICLPADRRPHVAVPAFWSNQFGINIKSVGVPTGADAVMIAQGSLEDARCVAVYGKAGRVVAAVSFDQGKWLESYARLIEQAAPFPLNRRAVDGPISSAPVPAGFGEPRPQRLDSTVVLTGYDPNDKTVEWIPRRGTGAPARVAAAD